MAQQKSKSVADKPTVVNKNIPDAEVSSQEDLISKIVGSTTAKVMEQLLPFLQGNTAKTDAEKQQTVKNVKERVVREMNSEYERVIKENRLFMERLSKAPKSDYRTISIPQVYRKYFGSQLVVGINGSFVTVPVDGRPHRVHKDFYSLIKRKLEYEDDKISTMEQTQFSDVIEVSDRDTLGQ